MTKKLGRLGMVAGVVTFARSPQGQQLIRRAQQWYADPVHQEQVRHAVTTSVAKVRSVAGRPQDPVRQDPARQDPTGRGPSQPGGQSVPRSPKPITRAD